MDTTPKYIKMCERAEEIQKLRKWNKYWHNGDWLIDNEKTICISRKELCDDNIYKQCTGTGYHSNYESIWLPTQTQLQKMVEWNFTEQGFSSGWGFEYTHIDDMFRAFWEWREEELKAQGRGRLANESITAEQLWLAFVMHEKYGKHWDNEKEEWVK